MQNILVDEAGKLTAVIDWECLRATIVVSLEGRNRDGLVGRITLQID